MWVKVEEINNIRAENLLILSSPHRYFSLADLELALEFDLRMFDIHGWMVPIPM